MATNYVQDGNVIEYPNTGSAISSGDVVMLGDTLGVALTDIAATTGVGSVQVTGVFTIAKDTSTAVVLGDALYWDAGNSKLVKNSAGGFPFVGTAAADALTAATTVAIKLNGGAHVSTITDFLTVRIDSTVANGDENILINAPFPLTITSITSKCTSGTATATFKIGATALGGTANSVSSSEDAQAHASDNAVAAGDDVIVTISSNSSCVEPVFTIVYTREL